MTTTQIVAHSKLEYNADQERYHQPYPSLLTLQKHQIDEPLKLAKNCVKKSR